MTTMMNGLVRLLFLSLCSVSLFTSLKHNLLISNDNRNIFKIETFGFIEGGIVDIKISDFAIQLSTKEKEAMREKESHQSNKTLISSTLSQPLSATVVTSGNSSTASDKVKVNPLQPTISVNSTKLNSTSTARRLQLLSTVNDPLYHLPSSSIRRALVDTEYKVGFVLRKARSESAAQADLEKIVERGTCLLSDLNPDDIVVDLSDTCLLYTSDAADE
mgnify:CR=1 FL=1